MLKPKHINKTKHTLEVSNKSAVRQRRTLFFRLRWPGREGVDVDIDGAHLGVSSSKSNLVRTELALIESSSLETELKDTSATPEVRVEIFLGMESTHNRLLMFTSGLIEVDSGNKGSMARGSFDSTTKSSSSKLPVLIKESSMVIFGLILSGTKSEQSKVWFFK